jgi:ribosomal-protein-alanine N-acetyltransferase
MMVSLAPLEKDDFERCSELERQLFPGEDPWSADAFAAEVEAGFYYVGAYLETGDLVGYAGLALLGRKGDYEAEVHTIGVEISHQGKGIGKALLQDLLKLADGEDAPVFLEVRTDNETAIMMYENHGFTRVGLRKRYYQPSGADAYTMMRPSLAQVKDMS